MTYPSLRSSEVKDPPSRLLRLAWFVIVWKRPSVLIKHVLTVLVFWSWVGQRTEHVKTRHVKTDRFRGDFRGHFRGRRRGTFRGDFRGESLKGYNTEVNVRGHSRGHPRGRSRGGFRGVKFRGSRALCLSDGCCSCPGFQLRLKPSDCSPGLAFFCFMGPWAFAWISSPTTRAKKGCTAHVFTAQGGIRRDFNSLQSQAKFSNFAGEL